jgi:hypothetical protein
MLRPAIEVRDSDKVVPAPRASAHHDDVKDASRAGTRDHLGDDVGHRLVGVETTSNDKTKRHRRIEMPARYVADRIRHRRD